MSAPAPRDLTVAGLRVAYRPGVAVVDGVDLTVPAATLTALLGASGCGKTTLLKTVAGLLTADGGDVRIGGGSVLDVPAERRPVGLVFQKPLLFPHLSVGDNVAFGLRMSGVRKRERRRRAAEMLDLVGLAGFAGRGVRELSGGQEQRVALARALVLDPQVLLLDEPFSQLDAQLRARMRELVRDLQRELSITTLFVTHDQQEAVEVADRIALMVEGRIEAHEEPPEFYSRPPTLRAARFFGATNEIPGTLAGTTFACAAGDLRVAAGDRDGPGVLVVRPEALLLHTGVSEPSATTDPVPARVTEARFRGTHRSVEVLLRGDVPVTVTVPPALRLAPGDAVAIEFPPAACRVLPPDGPQQQVPAAAHTPSTTEGERSRAS
ncbi:ABC transporter ATP-binding protein [Pseudonocardia nigra]|uniref:ABC transporter ATP-binding protein n=1 Tax=Pseudonocardia nigra TaxID=1921578 RepID=UPI001C5F6561|nr:ABC transporter ATP-binding protein [Pseudonocardia nigra]